MPKRNFYFLITILMMNLAVNTVTAAEIDGRISITEYEFEDYIRNRRMEEEDRLRGTDFTFKPGLEIITDVEEVEIEFFEEKIGQTPWEVDNLAAGAYRVKLERTGYEILEFWVSVRNDRRTVVLVDMGKPVGTLILNNIPPGAEVTIDRVPMEGTRLTAAAGNRSLKVSAFGWETVQTTVDIPSGESLEWIYDGKLRAFEIETLEIHPQVLPPDDRRGFQIAWSASSGGSADIRIITPGGVEAAVIPFAVSSSKGRVYWIPAETSGNSGRLEEGKYRVVARGTGYDTSIDSAEAFLILDNRFKREPRPVFSPLPGLMYSPGTAMLPRGIWQASTGAGVNFKEGIPVVVGIRFSPVSRGEFSARFSMTARDPFDTTSIGFSFSGSWRATPGSGPLSVNLALLFFYDGYAADFGRIPGSNPGTALPGLQFSIPMEYELGNWNVVLSPSAYLTFPGNDAGEWRFQGPARMVGSIGTGVYYEGEQFLAGISAAFRGPDYPQGFLDYTLWSGLEGRFDLPGDASYLAAYAGVRTLDADPVLSMGIEFGVIR